jgi:hypothetical protein
LDAKEKAKEKDKHTSGTKNRSAANMMQKNVRKSKGKGNASQTTNFKNKGKTEKKEHC